MCVRVRVYMYACMLNIVPVQVCSMPRVCPTSPRQPGKFSERSSRRGVRAPLSSPLFANRFLSSPPSEKKKKKKTEREREREVEGERRRKNEKNERRGRAQPRSESITAINIRGARRAASSPGKLYNLRFNVGANVRICARKLSAPRNKSPSYRSRISLCRVIAYWSARDARSFRLLKLALRSRSASFLLFARSSGLRATSGRKRYRSALSGDVK